MKQTLIILFFLFTMQLKAQRFSITGEVMDEKAAPLGYATIALMYPGDSTLAFFGVSDLQGHYEIKNISAGNYILQAAFISYRTFFKNVELPLQGGSVLGAIIMKPIALNLKEAEVSSERIPLLFKKDTTEYDAAAFKTKPDAAVEDLLKKLPGVEVDRAGNIKAMGEDVKNVLVDGKEFFGSDPKVATKNLPADAVDKVQVYNKKSDESELTGIDDGSRKKTINLLLKDDKKSAWLGDVLAGTGTHATYQASAKAYRFTKQSQFAALGMLNNINQFGFSFRDYIDFNGGVRSLMDGSGDFRVSLNDDNSLPINFGQPITGLITSGAGGLNYTYEKKKDNRFNISYLGNGADKKLLENTITQNFTTGNSFTQNENLTEANNNRAHRMNFGWRNKIDSTQNMIVNGSASLTNGDKTDHLVAESFSEHHVSNQLNSATNNTVSGIAANAHASYLKKGTDNWTLFKITGDASGSHSLTKAQWENMIHYFSTNDFFADNQFQHNTNDVLNYSMSASVTRKTGKVFYIEPEIRVGIYEETLKRKQGIPLFENTPVDSLSPYFKNQYQWIRPAISLKRSNEKSQLNISAKVETGKMNNSLNMETKLFENVFYFVPRLSWTYEYKRSRRLSIDYESSVNIPNANQLLPVVNTINPLQFVTGNQHLSPEYVHNLQANWMLFDQFSFTSVFASLRATYTKQKINWSRTVDRNLGQSLMPVNVADDYKSEADVEFSTPVRKLGMNIHANATEQWNRGINPVNLVDNINTNFSHSFTLSVDNRKKEKWEASAGGTLQLSTAKYSIQQSLNNRYFNTVYFSELSFTPNVHWFVFVSADVTHYNARSFNESITIPLLKASISRYLLKGNRGVITIEASDLLDKNTGVQRISEMNYLRQKQSNIIGRYFMFSFKYRLNKFDDSKNVDVKINKR